MSTVDRAAVRRDAHAGGLRDRVRLGVGPAAHLVPLPRGNVQGPPQASDVQTVLRPHRGPYIAIQKNKHFTQR